MRDTEKNFKIINISIMIIIMTIVAVSNNNYIRYLIVSIYLIVLLILLSYYIFKNRPIKRADIISGSVFISVLIMWFIYVIHRLA